jgi:hypothetical protein
MQLGPHRLEEIREGKNRSHCIICGQTWTREPRSACPGVPTYSKSVLLIPRRSLNGYYATFIWNGAIQRTPDMGTPVAALAQA